MAEAQSTTISGAYCDHTTQRPEMAGRTCATCGSLIRLGYFAFADALEHREIQVHQLRRDLRYRAHETSTLHRRLDATQVAMTLPEMSAEAAFIARVKVARDLLAENESAAALRELNELIGDTDA